MQVSTAAPATATGSTVGLFAWGANSTGELGNGVNGGFSDALGLVSLPSGVTPTAIAGGGGGGDPQPSQYAGYAIGSDRNLYAWGDNFYGELGNGLSPTNSSTPVLVSLPSGVTPKAIAGGGGFALAIGSDGHLYSWGLNTNGALGNGSATNSSTPVVVSLPAGVTPTAVTGGGASAHAIGSDGNLYGWGLGTSGQLCVCCSDSLTPIVVPLASGVTPKAIADNMHTGYAIGSDGNIYAWGYGLAGELGDGTTGDGSPPVVVSLPPGSTPESLGTEPGSTAGYAIASVPNVAPTVTTQPTSQSVTATQSASFTAAASGFPTPTVQWQVSTDHGITFSSVSGATSDTLTISATTTAENGNEYEAVFTNGSGSATTNPATLTVIPDVASVITTQPVSQTVPSGQTVTFTAAASGDPTPTVQRQLSFDHGSTWLDTTLTSPSFSGMAVPFANGWEVRAVFTNFAGSATINAATLTVT